MASITKRADDYSDTSESRSRALLDNLNDVNLLASYYASGGIDDFLNEDHGHSSSTSRTRRSNRSSKERSYETAPQWSPPTNSRGFAYDSGNAGTGTTPSSWSNSRYSDADNDVGYSIGGRRSNTAVTSGNAASQRERDLLERERELAERERILAKRDRELREREMRDREARRRAREEKRGSGAAAASAATTSASATGSPGSPIYSSGRTRMPSSDGVSGNASSRWNESRVTAGGDRSLDSIAPTRAVYGGSRSGTSRAAAGDRERSRIPESKHHTSTTRSADLIRARYEKNFPSRGGEPREDARSDSRNEARGESRVDGRTDQGSSSNISSAFRKNLRDDMGDKSSPSLYSRHAASNSRTGVGSSGATDTSGGAASGADSGAGASSIYDRFNVNSYDKYRYDKYEKTEKHDPYDMYKSSSRDTSSREPRYDLSAYEKKKPQPAATLPMDMHSSSGGNGVTTTPSSRNKYATQLSSSPSEMPGIGPSPMANNIKNEKASLNRKISENNSSRKSSPSKVALARKQGSGSGSSPGLYGSGAAAGTDASKAAAPFDVIDRLDISGIYGGGSFYKHDGPYAAAAGSSSNTHAPIAAFPADALDPLAQLKSSAGHDGGYAAASAFTSGDSSAGSNSKDGSSSNDKIAMGFPSGRMKQKERELAEMYGLRDLEAWEDFGTGGVEQLDSSTPMYTSSSSSSRADNTSDYHGDMEATLRSSTSQRRQPASSNGNGPPPPAPIDLNSVILNPGFPDQDDSDIIYAQKPSSSSGIFSAPRRSKSIGQRLRSMSVREKSRNRNPHFDAANSSYQSQPALSHSHSQRHRSQSPSQVDDDDAYSQSSYEDSLHGPTDHEHVVDDSFMSSSTSASPPTGRSKIHWGSTSAPNMVAGASDDKKSNVISRFLKLGRK